MAVAALLAWAMPVLGPVARETVQKLLNTKRGPPVPRGPVAPVSAERVAPARLRPETASPPIANPIIPMRAPPPPGIGSHRIVHHETKEPQFRLAWGCDDSRPPFSPKGCVFGGCGKNNTHFLKKTPDD